VSTHADVSGRRASSAGVPRPGRCGKNLPNRPPVLQTWPPPGWAIHGVPSPTACRRLSGPKPAFAAQRSHCRPLSSIPSAKCPPNTGHRCSVALPNSCAMQSLASFYASTLPLRLSPAPYATSTTGTIEPSISPMKGKCSDLQSAEWTCNHPHWARIICN
jgi:hypothetical protein